MQKLFASSFLSPNSFFNCRGCLASLRPSLVCVHGRFGCSLFKEHDHVVVNVEADVAVSLILHRETAAQNDQTVPRFAEFVIEFSFDILSNIRVIRLTETLKPFDD